MNIFSFWTIVSVLEVNEIVWSPRMRLILMTAYDPLERVSVKPLYKNKSMKKKKKEEEIHNQKVKTT